CVVKNGETVWRETDNARLTMRNFSDEFLAEYLEKAGEEVQASVGAYRLEDIGAQLFTGVEGDFFTVLGLPLLPLLEFLRGQRILTP
ncbi:MAG: Maf family protein, partial [Rhodospirillales bacterium]|nr:Maf family protein [Rhodospirillales bacterium]